MLDLRSDTVTQPTAAMRVAMANAVVGDDVIDGDPTVLRLEATVAERLGMERALFFPTGTMANQVAVAVHTVPGSVVLVDANAHLVLWELAGAAVFSGVQLQAVRPAGLVATAQEFAAALRPPASDVPDVSLFWVENTHNGAGGVIAPLAELQAIRQLAGKVPVHMDGARLWNATIATGVPLADYARAADTVMLSFSKGLGAPVGAVLVGPAETMQRARRLRKRFGGGMRQSGILAAGALHGLQHRLAGLADDHAAATELAAIVRRSGARVAAPETNIVMIDLPTPCADDVVTRAATAGVRVSAWTPSRIRAVTHQDAPLERVRALAPMLRDAISAAME